MNRLASTTKRITGATFVALLMPLFVGCTSVPKIAQQAALKPGPKPRPIVLDRVAFKLERGQKIGTAYPLGLPPCPVAWDGGRLRVDPQEFAEDLQRRFQAIGLKVLGDPTALFGSPAALHADYLIGALITDVKMNVVYPFAQYGNLNTGTGSAYVEVEWQVFDQRSQVICLRVASKGSVHSVSMKDAGPTEPLMQAFGMATQNLLADEKFMNLVAPAEDDKPKAPRSPITLELTANKPTDDSPQSIIDHSRVSVLTLIIPGVKYGSGFLITADGYALTNEHVVGDAASITAKTVTGRELIAEVIRVDRERDVALIKLEVGRYEPLPLGSSTTARPGADVYAIGTPEDETLGQSVTRGIVSGFRVIDDQRFIQSDVTINHGNSGGPLLTDDGVVIGIAVLKRGDAEGISFFVPIEEALQALAIVDANATAAVTSKPAEP